MTENEYGKRKEDALGFFQRNPLLFLTIFGWLISLSFIFGVHLAQSSERDHRINDTERDLKVGLSLVAANTQAIAVLQEKFTVHIQIANDVLSILKDRNGRGVNGQ